MFIYLLFIIIAFGKAKKLPDIYWNSTNQIFDISNTDHVMSVKLLDRVSFFCPQPSNIDPTVPYEYTKLYAVSREGYDNCELRDERLIGVCQSPDKQSSISIVFRDFSPLPGALEFQAGQSYYIISTSDGTQSGIDRKIGGLCESKHMKVKFEVHSDRIDSPEYVGPSSAHFRHQNQNSDSMSTPLLYIIHTSDNSAETYSAGENDDGGASNCWTNTNLLLLTILFYLIYLMQEG